ncbi:MAG TPA: SRPBCC family protein [Longimicrobiales bacterium]|nr:SRPBCC family protein [Longimicrobiales bacterium]
MTASRFEVSAVVHAPPEIVYSIIADYRESHPRILPRPPFVSLVVEEGGTGAGTVIRVEMRVLGRRQSFRAEVAEPEPGRRLVETTDTGYVTTFTVEPAPGGYARATIATEMPRAGALERWAVARLLRPAYARELALLDQEATTRAGTRRGA